MGSQTKDAAGIVLAAGKSSRMGSNKLLLPIGGLSIIEHCIRGLLPVCSRVVVVLGYGVEHFAGVRATHPEVDFVVNESPDQGMLSSVLAGVRLVRESKAFILPGDCPLVPESVYRALLMCRGCSVPAYHGLPGHPVLVDRTAMDEMLYARPASLRQYLLENGYETVSVEDDRILLDIDDGSAYQEACDRYDPSDYGGSQ